MIFDIQYLRQSLLQVISSSNPEDDCYLYKLADFRKSGQLVDKFLNEGSKGLDDFIQKLGPFMYWQGKGELITRSNCWICIFSLDISMSSF